VQSGITHYTFAAGQLRELRYAKKYLLALRNKAALGRHSMLTNCVMIFANIIIVSKDQWPGNTRGL
jgi:hypothetical protein